MIHDPRTATCFTDVAGKWILNRQVSIYLRGREKPMTGLTVCQVQKHLIVARWNSSTHLIPAAQVVCIRFSPDCEPARDIKHPLNPVVRHKSHCRFTQGDPDGNNT